MSIFYILTAVICVGVVIAFAVAIWSQGKRDAEIGITMLRLFRSEATNSEMLTRTRQLFDQLSARGKKRFLPGIYEAVLSRLQRQPGDMELRIGALTIGRLAYSAERPNGIPTIYDEQAVQNDILVRTAGATPATPQPIQPSAPLPPSPTHEEPQPHSGSERVKALVFTAMAAGIVGSVAAVCFSWEDGQAAQKEPRPAEQKVTETVTSDTKQKTTESPETKAMPYRLVGAEDNSIGGRKRTSVKIVLEDKSAKPEQVHSTLLKVAQTYGGDAVFVYGYWPGDEWRGVYTAGRLEWGKDGKGWSTGDRVPADGKFDGTPAKLPTPEEKITELKVLPKADPTATQAEKPKAEPKVAQAEKPIAAQAEKSKAEPKAVYRVLPKMIPSEQPTNDIRDRARKIMEEMDMRDVIKIRDYFLDFPIKTRTRVNTPYTDLAEQITFAAEKQGEYVTSRTKIELKKMCEKMGSAGMKSVEEDILLYSAIIKYKEENRLNERQWEIIERHCEALEKRR